jgi:hypothetical protein
MLRLKNIKNINPYFVGEKIEFLNKNRIWIKGEIIDFKVTGYVYKAIIKCEENKKCRNHYICICSLYLRKCN